MDAKGVSCVFEGLMRRFAMGSFVHEGDEGGGDGEVFGKFQLEATGRNY